jgi:hypothetical protein
MSDYLCDNKCSHNKWYKTSYTLEVQKGLDTLKRGSCQHSCISVNSTAPQLLFDLGKEFLEPHQQKTVKGNSG